MTMQAVSASSLPIPAGQSDAVHPNPAIASRLARIYRLNRDTINLRLERSPYNVLLERLGNPHLDLPPTIHVAGTNGKGSTIAFIRSILQASHYRIHQYTSPHLNLFNERIVLGGQDVTDDELLQALDHVDVLNGDNPVTFFEYTTALAFYLYSKHKVNADILLLEVGMGGRLDCTNIIEAPLCTAITKIGFDHQQYLGDTAALIAAEKAGIMKKNAPCVIGIQDFADEVNPVFERIAGDKNAALIHADHAPRDYDLGLAGAHQYENAGTALAVISLLQQKSFSIPREAISSGLKNAAWRGRLEHIHAGKLYAQIHGIFGDETSIYIDGGHNVTAAYALRETLTQWKSDAPQRPIIMMLGMGHDKDVNGFLDVLADDLDHILLMDVVGGLHPQSATALAAKLNPAHHAKSQIWADYLSSKTQQKDTDNAPIILICGSLFLYSLL